MSLYLIKSFIISALLYGLYKIILQGKSNLNFNRFYILAALLIIILWPMVNISFTSEKLVSFWSEGLLPVNEVESFSQNLDQSILQAQPIFDIKSILIFIYAIISSIFLGRFFLNLYNLLKVKPKGIFEGLNVYPSSGSGVYSFFNRIYIPQDKTIGSAVLKHEKAHAKQLHSLDICLIELISCAFWFNPFIWLFRKTIKKNHEYLADQVVLENYPKQDYLQQLMQHLKSQNEIYLSNHFSYSLIKNRIKMIKQKQTSFSRKALNIGMALSASLLVLSAFSFKTQEIDKQLNQKVKTNLGVEILKAPSGIPIEESKLKALSSMFGKRNNPLTKKERMHTGIDLLAAAGTKILASGSGKVITAEYNENHGNYIVIEHNSKYSTKYSHLKSLTVEKGDNVNEGEVIGEIGTSGRSTGIHLHFEVHEYGEAVNPLDYVKIPSY